MAFFVGTWFIFTKVTKYVFCDLLAHITILTEFQTESEKFHKNMITVVNFVLRFWSHLFSNFGNSIHNLCVCVFLARDQMLRAERGKVWHLFSLKPIFSLILRLSKRKKAAPFFSEGNPKWNFGSLGFFF